MTALRHHTPPLWFAAAVVTGFFYRSAGVQPSAVRTSRTILRGTLGCAAFDHRERRELFGRLSADAVDRRQQQLDAARAGFAQRLPDRGQTEDLRELAVVE